MRNVIIELKHTPSLEMAANPDSPAVAMDAAVPSLAGVQIDPSFAPVQLPRQVASPSATFDPFDTEESFSLDTTPESSTYLVRGQMADDPDASYNAAMANPEIVAIYSDPQIEVCAVCPGSPPLGTEADVARLAGVPQLAARQMNGSGVLVAIVDTGINMAYLRSRGKNPNFDAARSWVPRAGLTPGSLPVGHGTMCAYDVTIAAPRCTLLDIALLLSNRTGGSIMEGLLSDAVLAYSHLLRVQLAPRRPGESRSLVVNNSWGMFRQSWDYPVGHPGNYSNNPSHPFNRIVGTLERAGADILFAAGNCGRACPDGRCAGITNAGIFGANSHPQVLSVAGVDVTKLVAGYSTAGPGRLSRFKPDIASYTHFRGSGVYAADGGTSAATPVAAGVVAAFRTRFGFNAGDARTRPASIRNIVRRTAEDRGAIGFDFDYGWGIISGQRLAAITSLTAAEPVEAVSTDELAEYELEQSGVAAPTPDEVTVAPEETRVGKYAAS
jgi:subtilisin family serine protease